MTPEKVLREYMHDVKNQQKICLSHNNIKDAEKLQIIFEDFKASLNLMNYFRSQHKNLKVVTHKEFRNAV